MLPLAQVVKELLSIDEALTTVAFSSCGKWLATGTNSGSLVLFDTDDNIVLDYRFR